MMRRLVLALCCAAAALPALADDSPTPQTAQTPTKAALGRLVVLAVKCGERPDLWGQRLDLALADSLRDSDGENGLRNLAETELDTLHQWQANPATACATVHDDPALTTADQLVGK
jgi:hypothetical protein